MVTRFKGKDYFISISCSKKNETCLFDQKSPVLIKKRKKSIAILFCCIFVYNFLALLPSH